MSIGIIGLARMILLSLYFVVIATSYKSIHCSSENSPKEMCFTKLKIFCNYLRKPEMLRFGIKVVKLTTLSLSCFFLFIRPIIIGYIHEELEGGMYIKKDVLKFMNRTYFRLRYKEYFQNNQDIFCAIHKLFNAQENQDLFNRKFNIFKDAFEKYYDRLGANKKEINSSHCYHCKTTMLFAALHEANSLLEKDKVKKETCIKRFVAIALFLSNYIDYKITDLYTDDVTNHQTKTRKRFYYNPEEPRNDGLPKSRQLHFLDESKSLFDDKGKYNDFSFEIRNKFNTTKH